MKWPKSLSGYIVFGAINFFIINLLDGVYEIYIQNNDWGAFWVIYAIPAIILGSIVYALIYYFSQKKSVLIVSTGLLYTFAIIYWLLNIFVFVA